MFQMLMLFICLYAVQEESELSFEDGRPVYMQI
jgi:hypothetical protein